ncbi:hypothetical protein [Fluviispira multicolorata]|uniref:Lipoprotein n=1 Tax=Fluviispira multicolorata TaxID=2654512 RepID=A0A833JDL3_9BACT|nr:hypothetical protein [Fluviispira multicolorata]KAB8031829.1 hypothetical protein GCL57_04085 [Fluviispira multicolorata]
MRNINNMNGVKIGLSCVTSLLFIAGCTSSSKYIKSEVIANSTKTLKTPDWALNSQVMVEDGGNFIFIHKMTLSGTSRPDACISMARTQAVGEMMKYIKNSVTSSGQVEELNASSDPSMSSLTAFLSQGNISGAKVTTTYWEQTMEADDSGVRPIKKLMCAVQVSIDKSTLERQMKDAINGVPGGNPEIRQKLLDAQKNFIEGVAKKEPEAKAAN